MSSGLMMIVTGPSGAGKTTVIDRVLAADNSIAFSVSHTTRPPRDGEVHGRDYYFVTDQDFDRMIKGAEFVEWANVHLHRYGTSRAEIDRLFSLGKDILVDVDYKGARAIRLAFQQARSIFILPPSLEEMRRRLSQRASEDQEALRVRLQRARLELAVAGEYDYNVVNRDLDAAVADVLAIFRAERLRAVRAAGLVRRLVAEAIE